MSEKIKSGQDVIVDFFAEIYNVPNTDKKTIDTLVSLFSEVKFTEKNIQNALDSQMQIELNKIEKGDD
jgi:hypothetical protein